MYIFVLRVSGPSERAESISQILSKAFFFYSCRLQYVRVCTTRNKQRIKYNNRCITYIFTERQRKRDKHKRSSGEWKDTFSLFSIFAHIPHRGVISDVCCILMHGWCDGSTAAVSHSLIASTTLCSISFLALALYVQNSNSIISFNIAFEFATQKNAYIDDFTSTHTHTYIHEHILCESL